VISVATVAYFPWSVGFMRKNSVRFSLLTSAGVRAMGLAACGLTPAGHKLHGPVAGRC